MDYLTVERDYLRQLEQRITVLERAEVAAWAHQNGTGSIG